MSGAQEAADALSRVAEEFLDLAKRAGAADAEVFGHGGTSLSAKVERGDLGQVQADEGTTLGLRVIVDGRLGFASTNQTDRTSLDMAARDAVEIARQSPADVANVLPEPHPLEPGRLMGPRVDPALASLEIADAVRLAQGLADATVQHDARISVDRASFSFVSASTVLLSTKGADCTDHDTAVTMGLMALAKEGDETGGLDYRGSVVRDFDRVEAESDRLARAVAASCVGNLGARAGSTYTGPVLFSPEAFATAFVAPLVSASSALAVQRGRSALGERRGEVVAGGLTIVDDPTDRAAAGAGAFDREGVPTSEFTLVEDGVLRSFLHNAYTAAVDGTTSTGHASGGARTVPSLGPHALQVASSVRDAPEDESALLRELGTGLYVHRIAGSVDAASGDFSGSAKSARWVENGEISHPVHEVMLSGNAFELLRESARASRTRTRPSGNALLPWALVDGVSVTAG